MTEKEENRFLTLERMIWDGCKDFAKDSADLFDSPEECQQYLIKTLPGMITDKYLDLDFFQWGHEQATCKQEVKPSNTF